MQPLVTDMDHRRLGSLLDTDVARQVPMSSQLLNDKLARARIVPAAEIPATVATMNSRIFCWSARKAAERELALVYPWDKQPEAGRYSVLSRIGVDLLGTIPGRRIYIAGVAWDVLCIVYQPEAEHAFHL
jgi:regulator of nucleoside diphosphate kinase